MKILIASDHVGYPLKQAVVVSLRKRGIQVVDAGTASASEAVDYPDYAEQVAARIASGEFDRGILVCGTGLGMSMAANRRCGVRAALCRDEFTARLARAHNDANVLCLGAWTVTPQQAEGILAAWIEVPFEAGRHVPRLAKLDRAGVRRSHVHNMAGTGIARSCGIALSPTRSPSSPLLYMGRMQKGLVAAAGIGLQQVEVSLGDPRSFHRRPMKGALHRLGLTLSAIATGQSCVRDDLCLGDTEPGVRRMALGRLQQVVDLAESFGSGVIIGGIRGGVVRGPNEARSQLRHALQSIRACARYAAGHGVTLFLEPINRYETSCINTVAEALSAIEQIGEPNVRLLLDTFHLHLEERDPLEALRMAKNHLGYIHLADNNRRAPGQGHLDFASILGTLDEIGYRGPLVGEFLPLPDDVTAMQQFGEFVKSVNARSEPESTRQARVTQ